MIDNRGNEIGLTCSKWKWIEVGEKYIFVCGTGSDYVIKYFRYERRFGEVIQNEKGSNHNK